MLRAAPATFSELKHDSGLTDGNLDGHLRRLEEVGYLTVKKRKNPLVRRGEETVYAITDAGKEAFVSYIRTMEKKIGEAKMLSSASSEKVRY